MDVLVCEELCQKWVGILSPQVSNIPREELDMQGRSATSYTDSIFCMERKKGKTEKPHAALSRCVEIVLCHLLKAFQAFQYFT